LLPWLRRCSSDNAEQLTEDVPPGARPPHRRHQRSGAAASVRTDGRKIVCAVRDELNDKFDAEELWVGAQDAPPYDR
jgi:hypothetical protein